MTGVILALAVGIYAIGFSDCAREVQAKCNAQKIAWEKLQPGQQIKPCGGDKTVKRVPGGVIVTHEGYRVGSTAFVPMKFEDEQ
jgi:hypothetical protein